MDSQTPIAVWFDALSFVNGAENKARADGCEPEDTVEASAISQHPYWKDYYGVLTTVSATPERRLQDALHERMLGILMSDPTADREYREFKARPPEPLAELAVEEFVPEGEGFDRAFMEEAGLLPADTDADEPEDSLNLFGG